MSETIFWKAKFLFFNHLEFEYISFDFYSIFFFLISRSNQQVVKEKNNIHIKYIYYLIEYTYTYYSLEYS